MSWLNLLKARLRGLLQRESVLRDIEEEMRSHLEMETQTNIERRMRPEEARVAALRSFGNIGYVRDLSYDVRGGGLLEALWQDVRYAIRTLIKNPGFTSIAVLTLALGIGANTAIFTLVNAVLLRPLPYEDPDRLMTFWVSGSPEGLRRLQWTEGQFAFNRDHTETIELPAAYSGGSGVNLTGKGEPLRLNGTGVTADFFRVLGREPILGRAFLSSEDTPGNNNVAILSYGLWQQRFGGDPSIVGQMLSLNNVPSVVVGIAPPDFDFPNGTELWMPVGLNPQNFSLYYLDPIARLKPGVNSTGAEREMRILWQEFADQQKWPEGGRTTLVMLRPLMDAVTGHVRAPLLVLLTAVGVVLLIACSNLTNLLLARATSRAHEIAIRSCLGATTWRILRQLLTESMLLAMAGAIGGVFLAAWGVEGLKHLLLTNVHIEQLDLSSTALPRMEQVHVDMTVLSITFGIALLTGLLIGIAPAWRAARIDLQQSIKESARSSASRSSRNVSNAFVVTQVALSLVLLVGATLLLKSFRNLLAIDRGFRSENVWAGRLELPSNKYPHDSDLRRFYGELLDRVEALPGVSSAGLCQRLPFFGGGDGNIFAAEGSEPKSNEPVPTSWWRDVSPGYFKTMGIPIIRGRAFQASDSETSLRVAIVDENFARANWPNGDPIGKRIHFAWGGPSMTVVGVAASIKHRRLDEDAATYVYWPTSQDIQDSMYLVVRTTVKPSAITSSVRAQVSALDADLPLFEVTTMEEAVARSLGTRRLTSSLLIGFAVTALLLASLGVYGVTSLNVGSRTNEFGIRLALGAQAKDLLKLVLSQAALLALTGAAIGLIASFAVGRFISTLLYGVNATDPLTFFSIALLLVIISLLACWLPARRAAKVDPLLALRRE